jgi:oligosaccharide translocation protein RFT1
MNAIWTHQRHRPRYLANRFSWRLMWLASNVYLQLILKHLLTQGDAMILAALSSLEDQGIFSLVSNYGGLVARVLFQPIEESSRNTFSRQLNSEGPHDRKRAFVEDSRSHLIDILRAYGILAILAISIGPTIVPLALQFLIGSHWMSLKVQTLLSAYCYYIPFLAFNGITEAFVSAAVNATEMRRQAAWMGIFSASFAAVSFLFLRLAGWGAFGLILANIINMSIRTLWSWLYIGAYLQQYNLDLTISDISPRLQTVGISVLAMSVMTTISRASSSNLYDIIKSVGLGGFCAFIM